MGAGIMKSFLWFLWKELLSSKSRLFLNVALVSLTVGLCVSIELVSLSREQAVKSQTYNVAPTVTILPAGVTQSQLIRSNSPEFIEEKILTELKSKYSQSLSSATGRLVFNRKVNSKDVVIIGYDPQTIISPFESLKNLRENRIALGVELSKRDGMRVGDHITIDGSIFTIGDVLPSSGTFEDVAVFMSLPAAQSIAKAQGLVNEGRLYAKTGISAEFLSDKLRAAYPYLNVLATKPGDGADGKIESTLKNHRTLLYGMTGLLMILCLFISAHLNAQERKLELATLFAIGASKTGVLSLVAGRSMIVSFIGSVAGCAAGAFFVLWQDYGSAKGLVAAWELFLIAVGVAVLSSILASLPAAVASGYRNHVLILQDARQ